MSDLEKIETTYDESQIQVLEGLDAVRTVSYTHLDVYKRQVMDGDLNGFINAYLKAASLGTLKK